MAMKEIGGYFELEHFYGSLYHEGALALSCGRACIEYLLRQKGIKKIALPLFNCEVVAESCLAAGAEIRFYHVGFDFKPEPLSLDEDEWLYVVNFYGQLDSRYLSGLKEKYSRIIVDNSHAYFQKPLPSVDTLYTCRKFLGVADGGFLYTDAPEAPLERDLSYERMNFLLGRYEKSAGEFYGEASANNDYFSGKPVKAMSPLTENLLRAVDYERVKEKRSENFLYLHRALGDMNLLKLQPTEAAYAYPLMLSNAQELKKELIANRIFVPTLWPNVLNDAPVGSVEYELTAKVLPLPCDQRYDRDDMDRIISFFK